MSLSASFLPDAGPCQGGLAQPAGRLCGQHPPHGPASSVIPSFARIYTEETDLPFHE